MKKSIYFIMTLAAGLFASCEPMDDIHTEIDAQLEEQPVVGTAEFSFTDEDYESLELNFGSFDSEDDARELIPALLDEKYPVWGEGSIAVVTFDVYNPSIEASEVVEREVAQEEYEELGFNYGNFDRPANIVTFLEAKYPDAAEGDVIELTYIYYAGTASTRTTLHTLVGGTWLEAIALESEDYTEMGESFANFGSREDAIADLTVFLGREYPYALTDDVKAVIYDLHVGGGDTEKNIQVFTYNGTAWTTSGNTYETTMQFGHNGDVWEPDNTIIYTLAPADFAFIGDQLGDKYDDPAWSAGNYSNFDRRIGNPNYWSDEMLLEAMNVLLSDRVAPNAEEGQKYLMIFDIYNGAAGTEQLAVIKEGDAWVLQ